MRWLVAETWGIPSRLTCFADDIGSIIPALKHLPKVYRAFNLFERISNLGRKAKKCVLIPLGIDISEELKLLEIV